MPVIKKIWAREILDSRGVPTIEAACQLDSGHVGVSSIPSGASTGTHEALELRDKDTSRYRGKGVLKAVDFINNLLGPKIEGMDPSRQIDIDNFLIKEDGTKNKTKYGANTTLAISEVIAKTAAMANSLSLYSWINKLSKDLGLNTELKIPKPIFNMINGGLHGAGNLDFQEFHVIPSSTKTMEQGLQIGSEIYMSIGENLAKRGAIHSVGDEGGFAPNLFTNADALELLVESIRLTNYSIGRDVQLGLDVAATVFYKNGFYQIRDKTSAMDENMIIDYYKALNDQYNLALLEDPLHEEAWDGWGKLNKAIGSQIILVGDDLLVTNKDRLEKAISSNSCNAILIKPNQVGTITETLMVIKRAREANWKVVVSHRSGETNDWFIADFSVGVGADYAKFGAPARGERVAKYNRLTSIEKEVLYLNNGGQ